MASRKSFAPDEWYHCYNRGVDKRKIFDTSSHYERFLSLLYVCDGTKPVRISNLRDTSLYSILNNPSLDRGETLVDIGAYALMPNHIHVILQEARPGGISVFMQKLF